MGEKFLTLKNCHQNPPTGGFFVAYAQGRMMQLQPDTTRTIGSESARAVAAVVAAILGLSLDNWVKIITICALLLSSAYSAWKWHRDWRLAKRQDAGSP